MDKPNLINARPTISWRRMRSTLIPFLASLIFIVGNFWVKDRCSILDCEPADWKTIQEFVVKNSGSWMTEYRLDYLMASPKVNNGEIIGKTNYAVYYVSTKTETTANKTNYPTKSMFFDDMNLWGYKSALDIPNGNLPPSENLEKLNHVLVDPEAAIKLTWNLAKTAFGQLEETPLLQLTFDNEKYRIESVWEVTYFKDDNNQIHYWVDAQSGKILESK
ncbi:MAG: PepSY domain-containing protein [Anaerolineales bacterium]|nr:PepSY domain-containing protein [Anaerolineales bacterium]